MQITYRATAKFGWRMKIEVLIAQPFRPVWKLLVVRISKSQFVINGHMQRFHGFKRGSVCVCVN